MSDSGDTERYTLGYGEGSMKWMTARTADRHGAFLLPYLKPGMRFLDCGCGPGTLTIGFAERVAPGETIGIDRETSQSQPVADEAQRRGMTNLAFVEGDVYALPWPDASFDAAFASAVLGSLADPARVVAEIARVVRPGGAIGLTEFDHEGDIVWPQNDTIRRSIELYQRLRGANGHNQHAGRNLKGWLAASGCDVDFVHARYDEQWRPEELSAYIERNNQLTDEMLAAQYIERGWATAEEIAGQAEEWRHFARDPAAILMSAWVEAVGIRR